MKHRMKLFGLLFTTVCQFSWGQSGNNSDCPDPSSSLLWKIEGDNSEVYLFGSLHLGLPEFYPLAEEIDQQFRSADYLVFEVDPSNMLDPALAQTILQKAMLGPDEQLSDMISAETLATLESTLQSLGIPAQQFMRFRPWFITLTLTSQQMLSLGYLPNYGVEFYLHNQKPADVEVLELESMDEQLAFLEELGSEAFLEYTLNSMAEGKAMMQEMAEAWACANKPVLTDLLVNSFDIGDMNAAEAEKLQALFLFERNKKMAVKIEDYINSGKGKYFVVVGAAHYLGDKSVVDLLQKKGYAIEAVKLQ